MGALAVSLGCLKVPLNLKRFRLSVELECLYWRTYPRGLLVSKHCVILKLIEMCPEQAPKGSRSHLSTSQVQPRLRKMRWTHSVLSVISPTCTRTPAAARPNTAVHGVDGHLLRVESLKIGDRVRLLDQTEASVLGMHLHRAKKQPYNLVELTTRQGCLACPSLTAWQCLHWLLKAHIGLGVCSADVSTSSMLATWFS